MSSPSFSVVIPTYNRAPLLMRTLNSVFAQTYPATEVIVVDNASTDDTVDVLEPLVRNGQIVFIRHSINRERAASRNTGMNRATGDYVTLLDSDDLMYPSALATAAAYVRKNLHVRLFHSRYELIDATGRRIHSYRYPSLANPRRAIADGNFMSCIGNFMHREIYERYRFNTAHELSGSEDWEFWLRIIADYAPGRISQVGFAILQHPGQTLARPNLDEGRRRLDLLQRLVQEDPHLSRCYAPYHQRLEASCLIFLAYLANTAERYHDALAFLAQARRRRPAAVLSLKYARIYQLALAGYCHQSITRLKQR